ncbi:MAG: 3-deoxy-D-manno-octulosonic acid transferase [Rhodobacteraceae bacterium]|nr:3-deoxy-D-manno-octulosonic acid transferase [Paracoccaceae bacterium]
MILQLFLLVYRLAWLLLLPVVLVYLWHRGRKDPDYRSHLAERFGFYTRARPQGVIWLHVVSLGETRSAAGLIRALLARGDRVLLTHFTPAGRRESARLFAAEIATGAVTVVWVPFDMAWCHRRFLAACRPRIGLTLEVEIWPAMIFTARAAGVPLYLCNGQYATRPLARDSRGLRLRQRVIRGLAGALVKSQLQADRFARIGLRNVSVTGELRFDQPVPESQLAAASTLRATIPLGREVITIASGVQGEEALFATAIQTIKSRSNPAPLFVYVPRAPERFDTVAQSLGAAGLVVTRRSRALGSDLSPLSPLDKADVLLGDSLGEMFFYLALCDRAIVGGGFTERGAHNIIEPLMLGKPVLTGPHVWTIEYPFAEAEALGIARSLPDADALMAALEEPRPQVADQIAAFLAEHSGASAKTLAAIDRVLAAKTGGVGRL